jgi:thioesterase domain-containing protein/acyl carrier protein
VPLTGNGKVDRAALLNLEQSRQGSKPSDHRPPSATEMELIAIWREVLGQPDIGLSDNFFDLGGHSLRAVKLMYLIHQRLGVLLPFTVIFEASTVNTLAAKVLDAVQFGHQSIDQPMVALTSGRGGATLFAFPPGTGDALGYGELARRLDPFGFYAFNFIEADTRIPEYADLILNVDGNGPYVLFGYSGGGNLAFRTAGELERRGKRVKDVVMLDSSCFLQAFRFPVEEARRLALEFVDADGVQAYVDNPVLKDKVIRMIERYYETLATEPDDALIDANIHVVVSENSPDEYRDDAGRLICSKSGWAAVTRNVFRIHQGSGEHGRMLHQPHLETNATLLRKIFEAVAAG